MQRPVTPFTTRISTKNGQQIITWRKPAQSKNKNEGKKTKNPSQLASDEESEELEVERRRRDVTFMNPNANKESEVDSQRMEGTWDILDHREGDRFPRLD